MRARAADDEPFAWWGPRWSPPAPRSVLDLIGDGVLSAQTAAVLWALLARRASAAVVAGPSGAGKTTLLTALLDLFPPDTRRRYLRGCYESFAGLDDAGIDPAQTLLLVNEISAHLPTYLWGPGVRRALATRGRGFALAATAHAATATEFVALLAGYPLRVPVAEIAAFDLVVVLDAWREGEAVRRELAAVTAIAPAASGAGLVLSDLVSRPRRGAPAEIDITLLVAALARLPVGEASVTAVAVELEDREAILRALVDVAPPDPATALAELGRRRFCPTAGGRPAAP